MACLPVAQGIVDLSSVLHEPALHKPARATSTQEPILAFMSRVWSMSVQNRNDVFAHLMVQIASRLDDAVAHSTDDVDLALDAACGSVRLRSGPELDDSQTIAADHRALLRHLAVGLLAASSQQDMSATCDKGRVHGLGLSIGFTVLPNNVGFPNLPMVAPPCHSHSKHVTLASQTRQNIRAKNQKKSTARSLWKNRKSLKCNSDRNRVSK